MPVMTTFSGQNVNPLFPKDKILLGDIAHALSLTCRFGGHTDRFYSVAQHSVLVARHVSEESKLQALMHDASEAYLGDIPKPLKGTAIFIAYKSVESQVMGMIAGQYGFNWPMNEEVEEADVRMSQTEAANFFYPMPVWYDRELDYGDKIVPWGPTYAERMFLEKFEELCFRCH